MAKSRPPATAKPPTPTLESAVVWAALARIAAKRAEETEIALELGDYKLQGHLRCDVVLGPRRKPRTVEAVLSADVDVDPPQRYSAIPREKPLLAGLLKILSNSARAEILRRLPKLRTVKLSDEDLERASQLLQSMKTTARGKKKRVGVDGAVNEVSD